MSWNIPQAESVAGHEEHKIIFSVLGYPHPDFLGKVLFSCPQSLDGFLASCVVLAGFVKPLWRLKQGFGGVQDRSGVPSGMWWSGQSGWAGKRLWVGSKVEFWSWEKGRFGAPGTTLKRHWESWERLGHWWTLGKTSLEVSTEHNISGDGHAGKEESKMSKIQSSWAGFHVPWWCTVLDSFIQELGMCSWMKLLEHCVCFVWIKWVNGDFRGT